jgi:metal-sulfur cluster biosynthetic enzyme
MIREDMYAVVAAMSPDVEDVEIELTRVPHWTPGRMFDDAKFSSSASGNAPQDRRRRR